MIILSILCLLFSNAVTLRRDMSILFNRIAIIALIYCFLHDVHFRTGNLRLIAVLRYSDLVHSSTNLPNRSIKSLSTTEGPEKSGSKLCAVLSPDSWLT